MIQRQSRLNSALTETLAMRRCKGSLNGYWEFPGGKREPGESLSGCLVRELREELSIDAWLDSELGVYEFNNSQQIIRLHSFVVTRWCGEIELRDHDKMCWLVARDIDQVQWSPADRPFVQRIKESAVAS